MPLRKHEAVWCSFLLSLFLLILNILPSRRGCAIRWKDSSVDESKPFAGRACVDGGQGR